MRQIKRLFFALVLSLLGATAGVLHSTARADDVDTAEWTRKARIAGAELYAGMPDEEVAALLDRLVSQHVSVVEADSDFSLYLSERQFVAELDFIDRFVKAAHSRGLRVVWYYPLFEVLTEDAKARGISMFQDHPDWVQRGLDGKPVVIYGGEERVHWVEEGMESAWMTLQSPYSEYLLDRITRIAKAGVDGLWLDVPLLSHMRRQWTDLNPHATTKFKNDTGLEAPQKADWKDPAWRQWITWRYQETADFLRRINRKLQEASLGTVMVVGNVTADNALATRHALDLTAIRDLPGALQAWDISPTSAGRAMRDAKADDWQAFIAMNKFARGASGKKPAWVVGYGDTPRDAELTMAVIFATGNHPHEAKVSAMTKSASQGFRQKAFGWARVHGSELFESQSAANVGVLFSRPSRDYMDQASGAALYASWNSSDPDWWSTDEKDSLYSQKYMAEYRGITKWLSKSHVPFDILVAPDQSDLSQYTVIIAPALQSVSDGEIEELRRYVEAGGKLVLTGTSPFSLNELGGMRTGRFPLAGPGLENRMGLTDGTWQIGEGSVTLLADAVGASYLKTSSGAAALRLAEAALSDVELPIQIEGSPGVHVELRKRADTTLIHLINIPEESGIAGLQPQDVKIRLSLNDAACEPHLTRTSPKEEEHTVAFERTHDGIEFVAKLYTYLLIRVSCTTSHPQPLNHVPIAQSDVLKGVANQTLLIDPAVLTSNDGDLDGHKLEPEILTPAEALKGDLKHKNGQWSYAPPKGFLGSETLAYRVKDGHGGQSQAEIQILVEPEIIVAHPGKIDVLVGQVDSASLMSLLEIDDKTFDIKAGPDGTSIATEWVAHTPVTNPSSVMELRFQYSGQFSLDGVTQTISVFNHISQAWEVLDEREVGTSDDTLVKVTIGPDPQSYISLDGSVSIRFHAHRHGTHFTQWANSIAWDVVKKH